MYFKFLRWLHRFEEQPWYWPPLAGLYSMLWARYCGHDWKFARRMGMIYWWPQDREEAPFEAILQASDKMVIAEAEADGESVHEIATRARERLAKAMAEADRRRASQVGEGR